MMLFTPGLISVATKTNPIAFGISIVASILGGLFGFGGGGATKALQNQINQLRDEFSKAIDTTTRFAWKTLFSLGALLSLFERAWVEVFHNLWDYLKTALHVLKRVLTEGLPRVLQAVSNLRAKLAEIYEKYLRPVLNVIQKVRKYLQVLKALHVPFADKLDKILVRVEGKIIAPYLYVLRSINGVGGWVNVVLTAAATIQRAVFVRTIFAYQADFVNLWWVSQQGSGGSGNAPSPAPADRPPSAQEVQSSLRLYVQTGAGPIAAVAERTRSAAQRAIIGA